MRARANIMIYRKWGSIAIFVIAQYNFIEMNGKQREEKKKARNKITQHKAYKRRAHFDVLPNDEWKEWIHIMESLQSILA